MTNRATTTPHNPLNDPAQFLALGLQLAASRAGGLATALAARALARHGNDPLWQALAAQVLRCEVPGYHLQMLRDTARNAAYRTAIERFAPGRVVLDIGTGSSLLAMMAARAGAARVFSCEANAMIAASASAVIAANGYADQITVYDLHSTTLDRVRDLAGGADLIVSEVFCQSLIGEGVLGSLAHARDQLAAPGALFLPERANIEVALAEFPPLVDCIGPVEGFDLSAFAPHLHAVRHRLADDPALHLRSAPATLFAFDFSAGDPPPADTAAVQLVSTGGSVSGLAQWLRLTFADYIIYENRPGSSADLHWVISLSPCCARTTRPGDIYSAGAVYAADNLVTWCHPPE